MAAAQEDWENRELLSVVEANVSRLVQFLNTFDRSTRDRLARINEKLGTLEGLLTHCEGALRRPTRFEDKHDENPFGPVRDAADTMR